jgi:methionine biosynthesis protein MetW
MRDSALKRGLVSTYFSVLEVRSALAGVLFTPPYRATASDYDTYWRTREPGGLHPRFEMIAAGIADGSSVLDVGCGDGAMLDWLAGRRQVRALGIDISQEAVRRARARGVDARVQMLADVTESFDHVIMSEVVEHVPDAEDFVLSAWRLARRSLWLTFPNIAYFPHRLRLLAGRFPVQWVVFPGEHLRFWSVPDFTRWLRSLSIEPAQVVASNGLTFAGFHRLWPNLLGNQIVVRCDR